MLFTVLLKPLNVTSSKI